MSNKEMTPRLLRANEIYCRVQQVTDKNGAVILLYKDARVDMNILDETFGPMNWQRRHVRIGDGLFCEIDVWDDDKKAWVTKQDVGVESNMDSTKGEASDAFKRAGFNFGIGRELYTAPFTYIQLREDEVYTNRNGKPALKPSCGFTVADIAYNEEREIVHLVIIDRKGHARFTHGTKPVEEKPTPDNEARIKNLLDHHNIKRPEFDAILRKLVDKGVVQDIPISEHTPQNWGAVLSRVHGELNKKK